MNFNIKVALSVLLGASVAATNASAQSSLSGVDDAYARYFTCVDAIATEDFLGGASAEEAIRRGLRVCRDERADYLQYLEADVERDLGRALSRSEDVLVERALINKTASDLYQVYTGQSSSSR
ncbi:MAG: hypothetical protein V2I43_05440 [Parvularcula sp.]|jgi:hypothetical protein|nr:hypothetical protein [Parvularcula sp.]